MLQERWRLNIELGRHNSISTVTQPLMRRKLRGFSVESLPTFAEACGTFVGTRVLSVVVSVVGSSGSNIASKCVLGPAAPSSRS